MDVELQTKIDKSLKILDTVYKNSKGKTIELCYSGGKDSDVILELANMASIPVLPIYKNTTIDPAGTIKHCLENHVQILQPKYSFYDIIKKKGFPTRLRRFCCSILKEYKVHDIAILGIRKSESVKRNARYLEPITCRLYHGSKQCTEQVFPILYWSDEDVRKFIEARQIKCHPLYYDEKGNFHVERRLGCMGCPLKSDNGLSHFKENPRLVRAWIKNGRIWWNTHPLTKTKAKFQTIEDVFIRNVFFKDFEQFKLSMSDMFGTINAREFLEKYFNINLD